MHVFFSLYFPSLPKVISLSKSVSKSPQIELVCFYVNDYLTNITGKKKKIGSLFSYFTR